MGLTFTVLVFGSSAVLDGEPGVGKQADAAQRVVVDRGVAGTHQRPWSSRAASETWRWLIAGRTVGKATALTRRMISITTSSSTRVNPRRLRFAPLPAACRQSLIRFMAPNLLLFPRPAKRDC